MVKECIFICANCKYANYYPTYFWFPFLNPACQKTKMSIEPEQPACAEFELIGRLSR